MKTPLTRVRPLFACCWLLAASAWLPSFAARADDASKAALVEEMFTIERIDANMQQALQLAQATQKAHVAKMAVFKSDPALANEVSERVSKLLTERLAWEKLKPAMVKLYADNFSEEELSASLAFYKSPIGQSILKKKSQILVGRMDIMQKELSDLTPEIEHIVQDAMAKHPAAKASPAPPIE